MGAKPSGLVTELWLGLVKGIGKVVQRGDSFGEEVLRFGYPVQEQQSDEALHFPLFVCVCVCVWCVSCCCRAMLCPSALCSVVRGSVSGGGAVAPLRGQSHRLREH